MLLVVGGCFQGKLEYVKDRFRKQNKTLLPEEILDGSSLKEMSCLSESAQGSVQESVQGNALAKVKVVNGLHRFVYQAVKRSEIEESGRPSVEKAVTGCEACLDRLIAQNPDLIVICDEVGYGVVPMDETECCYREAVGRVLCCLAQQAESMERIVAGVPIKIK